MVGAVAVKVLLSVGLWMVWDVHLFSLQVPVFSTSRLGDSTLGDLSFNEASVTAYSRHRLSL